MHSICEFLGDFQSKRRPPLSQVATGFYKTSLLLASVPYSSSWYLLCQSKTWLYHQPGRVLIKLTIAVLYSAHAVGYQCYSSASQDVLLFRQSNWEIMFSAFTSYIVFKQTHTTSVSNFQTLISVSHAYNWWWFVCSAHSVRVMLAIQITIHVTHPGNLYAHCYALLLTLLGRKDPTHGATVACTLFTFGPADPALTMALTWSGDLQRSLPCNLIYFVVATPF